MSIDAVASARECPNGTTNIDSLNPHTVLGVVCTVGVNAVSFQIQDGATAVNLFLASVPANGASVTFSLPKGFICPNGIKAIVTGVGGLMYVYYN